MTPSAGPLPRAKARLVVLVSGSGSNLQAIIDAVDAGLLDAAITAVVSNRPDAYGLERATSAGIPTEVVTPDGRERRDYDAALAQVVAGHEPDVVVLAGWMRLLSMAFLERFPDRVVNLHPALPGEYPGTRAIERAWDDALAGRRDHTGVMIHLVPDEGVDDGPVLATARVGIDISDGFDRFAAEMHRTEHDLLVRTLADLVSHDATPGRSPITRPHAT